MDLEGIADFIALAECRSFSKAAAERNITQPAFSRRIQALEISLDAQLVDRTVTPIELTPAGNRFLTYARNMREVMDQAVEDIQSSTSALSNPLHIVMPHSLSVTFFPQWYRGLQRCIHGLQIRLSNQRGSRCVTDLRRGLADLAILLIADGIPGCFDLDGIETRVIGGDRLVAVRASATTLNKGFLCYGNGAYMQSCAAAVIQQNIPYQKIVPIFESNAADVLRAMALAGFGTAVLQESLIEDDLRDGFLVPAFPDDLGLNCRIMLLRMAGSQNKAATELWDNAA